MFKRKPNSIIIDFIKHHRYLAFKALILANLFSVFEVLTNSLVLPLTQILGGNSVSSTGQTSGFFQGLVNFHTYFPKQSQLSIILILFLCLTVFKNISLYLSSLSINDFALKGGVFIRQKCIERFLQLDVSFYTQTGLGEILSYVNEQAKRTEQLFSIHLEIVREVISITFLILFLIVLSPILTLLTVFSLLIVGLLLRPIIRAVQFHGSKSAQAIENFASLITEIISGIRVVKSFNSETRELKRTQQSLNILYQTELAAYRFNSAVAPVTETAGISVLLIILMAGSTLLSVPGGSTLPILLTYTLTLLRTLPRVTHLNSLRSQISLLSGSLEAIERFLTRTDGLRLVDGRQSYHGLNFDLIFENLTFTFPTSSKPTLHNISFRIPKGTTTAIVGSSGSGKSTLVDLLMRFYDPDRGSIRVNGIDLRELNIGSWRRSIAVVSQDNFLFNESIRENIAYGCPDATDSDIFEAAKKAYAYEFIQELPAGFETIVGNRGTRLSGGQRQRIAIARAILCSPDLLILDEATSALDSNSEKIVQKAIEKVSYGRTTIAIAHRLSTIERADNIIVLDGGTIVEQGNHQELLAVQGKYWSLYKSQVSLEPPMIESLGTKP
jgi:ATP-binding cassette, subfamily B, bacterial MsbA